MFKMLITSAVFCAASNLNWASEVGSEKQECDWLNFDLEACSKANGGVNALGVQAACYRGEIYRLAAEVKRTLGDLVESFPKLASYIDTQGIGDFQFHESARFCSEALFDSEVLFCIQGLLALGGFLPLRSSSNTDVSNYASIIIDFLNKNDQSNVNQVLWNQKKSEIEAHLADMGSAGEHLKEFWDDAARRLYWNTLVVSGGAMLLFVNAFLTEPTVLAYYFPCSLVIGALHHMSSGFLKAHAQEGGVLFLAGLSFLLSIWGSNFSTSLPHFFFAIGIASLEMASLSKLSPLINNMLFQPDDCHIKEDLNKVE
jgi:hypothetical protein